MTFAPLALHQWREVQEQLRMNEIYQGLRCESRPRYVFHGDLSLVDFRKKFRDRKTVALFPPLSGNRRNGIKIPGLKTRYIPIMGASPGTYYLRANGTAASVGDATGPGDTQSACMNVSIFNADALNEFAAGDTVKACDDGGVFRATLQPPQAGSSGLDFTIEPENGDSPRFYGSTAATSWTEESSNIWYASFAADPNSVWFINTDTTIKWGKEETVKGNLSVEYEWWWDSGNSRIYVYCEHASGPDVAYTSVEGGVRQYGVIVNGKDYVALSGLETAFATDGTVDSYGILFYNSDHGIIKLCTSHHNGYIADDPQGNGISYEAGNNGLIQSNITHNNGRRGIVIFGTNSLSADDVIIELNESYNNYHALIDCFRGSGSMDNVTVRYNYGHNDSIDSWITDLISGIHGIYIQSDHATEKALNPNVYYNLIRDCYKDSHICFSQGISGGNILNNVAYGSYSGSTFSPGIEIRYYETNPNINATIKNNIGMDNATASLYVENSSEVLACDHNCWYQSEGGTEVYAHVDGTNYHHDDFDANEDFKGDTGWETNGFWEDPLFLDGANDDFHPQSGSPCIEAGTPIAGLTIDFYGVPLGRGTNPDIGASETLKGGPRRL